MAISGGVRVEGLARLTADLQKLGVDIDDLKDTFAEIAAAGAKSASTFAPRRSGQLAAGIRGNRAKNQAVVTAGGAKVRYARPINYGWPKRNIKANGFMDKAEAEMAPKALDMLEAGIERAIRKAGLA